jgi:thermitase
MPMPIRSALLALAAAVLALPAAAQASDVIVGFEDDATPVQREAAREAAGAEEGLGAVHGTTARVLKVDGPADRAVRALENSPGVAYAEPNARVTTAARAKPNDPSFPIQYWLDNRGAGGAGPVGDADIDAPEGWGLSRLKRFPASGGPRIAIVDTGIDQFHPELRGKIVACAQSRPTLLGPRFTDDTCSDDHGHGTHVAGNAAATPNNGEGIAGVAFDARLIICRALVSTTGLPVVDLLLGPVGDGDVADVAACIRWAADQHPDVISMSFESGFSPSMQAAIGYAWNHGKGPVLVAAAGNEGSLATRQPAGAKQVVSVAATDNRDKRASFSNMNDDVEIAAPGDEILSARLGGGYTEASGTSQATPIVAAAAGLIASEHPRWNAKRVRKELDRTSDDLGAPGRDPTYGFGRVNLCNALGGDCAYRPKR